MQQNIKSLNLLIFETYNSASKIKCGDLIHIQTPELAINQLNLIVEINCIKNENNIIGTILGTEGFNRGSSKNIFRKIYAGDFAEFDIRGIKSGSKILFCLRNIKKIL